MAGVLRMLNPLAQSDETKKRKAFEARTKNLEGNMKVTEGIILEIDTWKNNIVADFPDYKEQVEGVVSKITSELSTLGNTLAGANKFIELNEELTDLVEEINDLYGKLSQVSDVKTGYTLYRSNKQRKKIRYGKKIRKAVEEYNAFIRNNSLKWEADQLEGQQAFGTFREQLDKLATAEKNMGEEKRLFKHLPNLPDPQRNPGGDSIEASKIELRDEFKKMSGGYTRKNRNNKNNKNNRNNKNQRRNKRTRRRNNKN